MSLWESRGRRCPCCSPCWRARCRGARQCLPSQGDPTLPPQGWAGASSLHNTPCVTAPTCHLVQSSVRVCHQPPQETQPHSPPSRSQLPGYQLPSPFSQRPPTKLNSDMRVSASSHRSRLLNYRLTTVPGSSLPRSSCKKIIKFK